jgi:large subunit ribosomal protein L13
MTNPKTYSQKPSEVTRRWILIDASEAPLGRIATQISNTLLVNTSRPTHHTSMRAIT